MENGACGRPLISCELKKVKTGRYHTDLEFFLENIPLFSSVTRSQAASIASCFYFREYKKDHVIFRQGDQSDAMYIIRSGAVLIQRESENGSSFQTELKRGDFFGEMALLSDLPRNATAKVTLDAGLFCLEKHDFELLLSENRNIGLFLSRLYARRLSSYPETQAKTAGPRFYTVSATDPDLGLSHFLYSLAYHISTESSSKVLVVEPHLELGHIMKKFGLNNIACPDESLFRLLPADTYRAGDFKWFCHESGFSVLQVNKGFNKNLAPVLPLFMENFKIHYDIIIFSLSHYFGSLEQQAARLCDKNLVLINNTSQALDTVRQRLRRLEERSGRGLDRIRVGVSHLCGTCGIAREELKKALDLAETPQIWVDRSDKAFNDQIDTEKHFPVRGARLVAREMAGVRTGLALGAGAARGWAHIGVLKVLEENNIHIDMIAGTSMGALVGAIFAAGGSVAHLKKYTIDLFPTQRQARKKIFDYTLPLKGFLKGKKALDLVSSAVNNADFMDLLIPTFIVGVDIMKGEEVLFETGDVAGAVRSSLSLPAVFVPHRYQGRWMVDGGLLNPVPVNILEQKGADRIISVCVESRDPDMHDPKKPPGIMGVITRTVNIVHRQATRGFAEKSDIVIYPDVNGIAWDDFHKGELLMQRGMKACEQVMDEIRTLVSFK